MSAHDHLSPVQFKHSEIDVFSGGAQVPAHQIEAHRGEQAIGHMWWRKDTGEVESLRTEPEHQRQGVATGMWKHAHSLGVTPPVHSSRRTASGDAWAQKMGGHLPPREEY